MTADKKRPTRAQEALQMGHVSRTRWSVLVRQYLIGGGAVALGIILWRETRSPWMLAVCAFGLVYIDPEMMKKTVTRFLPLLKAVADTVRDIVSPTPKEPKDG